MADLEGKYKEAREQALAKIRREVRAKQAQLHFPDFDTGNPTPRQDLEVKFGDTTIPGETYFGYWCSNTLICLGTACSVLGATRVL